MQIVIAWLAPKYLHDPSLQSRSVMWCTTKSAKEFELEKTRAEIRVKLMQHDPTIRHAEMLLYDADVPNPLELARAKLDHLFNVKEKAY